MFRIASSSFFLLQRKLPTIQPINSVSLVGVAHDIQHGFIGEEAITQFQLTVTYAPVHNEAPIVNSSSNNTKEKEFFTVRCAGGLPFETKQNLADDVVVAVKGSLKMNLQPEPMIAHRHFSFPFINVRHSSNLGSVEVLNSKTMVLGKSSNK